MIIKFPCLTEEEALVLHDSSLTYSPVNNLEWSNWEVLDGIGHHSVKVSLLVREQVDSLMKQLIIEGTPNASMPKTPKLVNIPNAEACRLVK